MEEIVINVLQLEVVMAEKKMKQWRCKNNHILGFVRWNGDGLPQLRVLRQALDMEAEHPDEVDLLGPLDGWMLIRCSICDDVKVWEISVPSLVAIFIQMNGKKVLEFSKRLLEFNRKEVDLEEEGQIKEENKHEIC